MFESAQLDRKISRLEFDQREPDLRERLLDAQARLQTARFSVVVVVAGAEGAGKGETVNRLMSWLDARGVQAHALGEPSEEERERPEFYRFWRRLPARGRIGVFFGSWYTQPVLQHSLGHLNDAELEDGLRRILDFERMLEAEGVLLVKLWLHVSKKQQKKKFKKLEKNPETAWRVTRQDWRYHKTYDDFIGSAGRALRRTDTGLSPWHIIESANSRYRDLTAAETLLSAIEARLEQPVEEAPEVAPLPVPLPVNVISSLQLNQELSEEEYHQELPHRQMLVGKLARKLHRRQRPAVLVFEGADAAGKGGAIRRLTEALDARHYEVVPIAAPTDEERARPYLWRFWRRLPRWGQITIFDRSWYGRVLVERLEGFCGPADWQRAFAEINSFEEQLAESGCVICKFWLSISPEEQLRRFQEREQLGFKRYKITAEDWRNRDKWAAYQAAACDMVERTSSDLAPWTLVEAENKYYARLKVLDTVEKALKKALS
ncbi:polyphosphate:AMP phosphotransferase [bacterium]|nr:polyphosphate:AMP phosphotransferase [bacterium]